MIKFLDLEYQNKKIQQNYLTAVDEIIHKSEFVGGARISTFEKNFAKYLNVVGCLGVGNGTDALEIAIDALQLPPSSKIIVPANSFFATAEAVLNCGHEVVFVDCNTNHPGMDLNQLEQKIDNDTAAVIVVHLYGIPDDITSIKRIIGDRDIYIIEDCAQAHGAEYYGVKVGGIGDISAFSFYPGKNLGAFGDAGIIASNCEVLLEKARMLANHGRIEKYNHEIIGRNSRLDVLQATALNLKIEYLDEWNEVRRNLANAYYQFLSEKLPIDLIDVPQGALPVYHLFPILTSSRDELKAFLSTHEIETGIHYPIALPDLPALQTYQTSKCTNASKMSTRLLSLPMGPHLSVKDIETVAEKILLFYSKMQY